MKTAAATLLALLAIACGLLWWQHREQTVLTAKLDNATTAALAAGFEASAARADVARVTQYVDRVRVVHDTTATIQQDIPRYVTPEADRLFPLSVGFVRVHDAAAAGVPLVPSARDTDATRAGVASSDAAGVIAGNYGACHETAAQLTALQDWVRAHEGPAP